MRFRDSVLIILGSALLLLIAVYGMRIAQHFPTARAELGRVKVMQLEEQTKQRLADLDHEVLITYYVSGREHMPSDMRRVERDVVDLLRAMRRESNGRLDFQIIDPETDPDFASYAAHQRVAPFRVRSVARDSYTERTVWSSLHITYGPHEPAVVNGVSPEHLPRLQAIIVGQIKQLQSPREPVFGVLAPEHYGNFTRYLRRFGRVIELGPDIETFSREIDVLFWIDPGEVSPRMVRELSRFLDSGRTAFITGSKHVVNVEHVDGVQQLELAPTDYDAEALLGSFGLRPIEGLILDQTSEQLPSETAPRPVRFFVRCIPPNQDFRRMRDIPNGHLLFAAPTPFALDGDALRELGYEPIILATTSDRTILRDMIYGKVDLNRTEFQQGDAAPKLPLMVWLQPHEPWRGSVVFAASSSIFRDGSFRSGRFAHQRLIEVLTETLGSNERLVMNRAGIEPPQPLPEMSTASRIGWRVFCIALLPIALLGYALWRGAFTVDRLPRTVRSAQSMLPLRAIAGIASVLIIAAVVGALGWRADFTESNLNQLAPATRSIASNAAGDQSVIATLYISPVDQLPPAIRPAVRRLNSTFRELQRAGTELTLMRIRPENLSTEQRADLAEQGIRPHRITTEDDGVTSVRNVYTTLVLESGNRREVLDFDDRTAFEHIEFRLAFALWRLQTGRTPHIAFIADAPRLSASEVYHDFQQRGLMAPSGTDVYALARDMLRQHDFRVTHIEPRRGRLPDDADLVIWMQPRRDMMPPLDQVLRALHRGTPVIIAAQHFNIQARQYRGDEFRVVYWPQPQVADVHLHYFPDIGIELVHEILFDDMKATLEIETQVARERESREYETQTSALPFLIRAVAANFHQTHPLMRGLGDQVLPFGAFFRLDEETLAAHGLDATVLMTTSERSWRFNWTGGWLPDDLLRGPREDDDDNPQWQGRLPLAILLSGRFPIPAEPMTQRDVRDADPLEFADERGEDASLLFIGSSEMFKHYRLMDADFRADHLLLNAAAHLALDDDLASIATHRRAPRGFDYVAPEQRLQWRAIVIGTGPLMMLVLAVGWTAWRRRTPESSLCRKPDPATGTITNESTPAQ